jgi:hypothetical protein
MKNKFVLTEEESKRILSLHKEKIDQERSHIIEQTEKYTEEQKAKYGEKSLSFIENNVLTVPTTFTAENADTYTLASELKIFKDSKFKPTNTKGVFSYEGNYQYADDLSGQNEMGNFKGTILYFCKKKKFKVKGQPFFYFIENYPVMYRAFMALCGVSSDSKVTTTPTPSKKGCPSIIKSFTDAGYTQITVERYRELANDKTRIRKYKFCPVTKKNLYFAKPQVTQTGPAPTPVPDGGETNTGGGGQTYPFDYDTILKAFPPDEIINPFEQGGEEEVQSTIVTDKMYAEF